MKAEIFMSPERLAYLKEELKEKVTLIGDLDEETGQQRIAIEITSDTDFLFIFHAGVRYGLDAMQAVFSPK